jgi:hypothetical protein
MDVAVESDVRAELTGSAISIRRAIVNRPH